MEQNSISSDLIRGHIDTIILYSLIDGDKFAQQISDAIEEKSNNEYKINQATLYSSLKRLETLKNVSSYMNDAGDLGRRKFFRLTPQGKNVVEQNLNNWSYSKNIIDKLMDTQTDNAVVKEKVVYVYSNDNKNEIIQNSIPSKSATTPEIKPVSVNNINTEGNLLKTNEEPQQSQIKSSQNLATQPLIEDKNEVNFRSILNSLIAKTQKINETKPESVMVDQPKIEETKQQSLNETILNNDFNKNSLSAGKIDFGDLKIQASKEGYKISVSSKDSAISNNYLLINKLNFWTAILLTLFCVAEFLPIYLVNKQILSLNPFVLVLFILVILAYPIYSLVKYLAFDNKKGIILTTDSILTCAIIIFNLLLLNVAIVFLADMDFTIKANLIKFIYTPVILMFNALAFIAIRYWLSNLKQFNKGKK